MHWALLIGTLRAAGSLSRSLNLQTRPCPPPAAARSVIKIILQFCKENGLAESFNAIQVTALLLRDVMCVLLLLLLLLCR